MTGSAYRTIRATLDDLGHGSSLEVVIIYGANPAEPMVRYDRDGSGYPGCDASAELCSVSVIRWDVGDEERKPDDHWIWLSLTEIATKAVAEQWRSRFEDLCLEEISDYLEGEC